MNRTKSVEAQRNGRQVTVESGEPMDRLSVYVCEVQTTAAGEQERSGDYAGDVSKRRRGELIAQLHARQVVRKAGAT